MVDLTIFAVEAIMSKLGTKAAWVVDLAIVVIEAILLKSCTSGSMSVRHGNYYDGSTFAEIECRW